MYLKKEKDFLSRLPKDTVRSPYRLIDHKTRIDNSSLFHYHGNQYSIPPEYIGKTVALQVYDDYIHVYFNTKLIAMHSVSMNKINYDPEHYEQLARKTHSFSEADITKRAKENLKAIGALYEQ